MRRESVVFLIGGTFLGLIVGWMIGSQQGTPPAAPTAAAAPAAQPQAPAAPPVDVQRATELEQTARSQPSNASVRAELGNLYFNAERFDQALPWYEQAQKLDPRDINVSTDLGVCYYYTNQPDRALQQFDHSLSIDPKHVKTLFNQGIVLAFGKQDLKGAEQAWQRVVELAPNSEEGRRAKQGLEGLKAGHAGDGRG